MLISRWLLAIIFITVNTVRILLPHRVTEINQFQGKALLFFNAIRDTGYLYYTLIGTELAFAILLISNKYLAVSVLLFAPLMLNIILFHIFLDPRPSRLVFVGMMTVCYLIVAYPIAKQAFVNL